MLFYVRRHTCVVGSFEWYVMVGRFPIPCVCGPALRGACRNPGTPFLCSGWLTIIPRSSPV